MEIKKTMINITYSTAPEDDSMSAFQSGDVFNESIKQKIRRIVRRNQIFCAVFFFFYVLLVPEGLKLLATTGEIYMLVIAAIMLTCGFVTITAYQMKLSRLDNNEFMWVEDIVTRRKFRTRMSSAGVFGRDTNRWYTVSHQFVITFRKNQPFYGIQYKRRNSSLVEEILMHDTLFAYHV